MKTISLFVPLLAVLAPSLVHGTASKPNLIIVFCDDLGYADIGPFGSKAHATPVLDRMAREGMRLTDFYSTCPVCTPSRSSLMTGCYPRRVNMHVDEKNLCVLFPAARKGLNPSERTIAEVLGERLRHRPHRYTGDHPTSPTSHGFDSYFGIPYSNDMNRVHSFPRKQLGGNRRQRPEGHHYGQYIEEAVSFIRKTPGNHSFFIASHWPPASGSGRKIQRHEPGGSLWGLGP